ncbi:MAG: hypothetical protein LKI25_06345 [Atopobiaceae bacterium]|jgi:hypothetical protein|nr:hypothetical protein [Atopobiaceae bacterium]MCI2173817.1 hypothetical protein [Atopobiaceae bacterium]MCI2207541.1 hypothetical protein [Atopobiaceae bacterium]
MGEVAPAGVGMIGGAWELSGPLFADTLFTIVQIAVAVWMFADKLPRRPHFALRACLVTAAIVCAVAAGSWVGSVGTPALMGAYSLQTQLVLFSAILFVCAAVVAVLCDASLWAVLFCATAGYTVQNIASSADALIELVMGSVGTPLADEVISWVVSLLVTVAVYVVCHQVMVKRIDHDGLTRIEGRDMLAMVAVVLFAVIGFDVVNKTLESYALPLPMLVALRVDHGIVCVFVLAMEYEFLYNRRLETEVDVAGRLMDEQRHRYETSRENLAAIDARAHDMRHHVIRLLSSADSGVDRELLGDVARELDVYDSHIRTANEALDVILTERSLICERSGISLACLVDGTTLSHVSPEDLYLLFDTLLSPIVSATRDVDDPDLRSIALDVRERAGMAAIHLECYLSADDGRADGPLSPADRRTVESIVGRYDGTVSMRREGDTFQVNAMLPLLEK